ncbi:hypothetical protein PE36_01702 [Moritella sp. PE36]|nr:hypothetical protein PE36_01702 [Moritella sp. PE36]
MTNIPAKDRSRSFQGFFIFSTEASAENIMINLINDKVMSLLGQLLLAITFGLVLM